MDGHTLVSRDDKLQAEGARAMCESIKHDFVQNPHRDISNDYVIRMCTLLAEGLKERYGI